MNIPVSYDTGFHSPVIWNKIPGNAWDYDPSKKKRTENIPICNCTRTREHIPKRNRSLLSPRPSDSLRSAAGETREDSFFPWHPSKRRRASPPLKGRHFLWQACYRHPPNLCANGWPIFSLIRSFELLKRAARAFCEFSSFASVSLFFICSSKSFSSLRTFRSNPFL